MNAVTVGVLLDDDHAAAVAQLRHRLGVPVEVPEPVAHVSLLVVLQPPPLPILDAVLAEAAVSAPVELRARGVGLFSGQGDNELVVYVPVVRTQELSSLHARLHDAVCAAGGVVDGHYEPRSWQPHVTVWDRTLTTGRVADVVAELVAGSPVGWTTIADHIARFDRNGDMVRYAFTGRSPPSEDR